MRRSRNSACVLGALSLCLLARAQSPPVGIGPLSTGPGPVTGSHSRPTQSNNPAQQPSGPDTSQDQEGTVFRVNVRLVSLFVNVVNKDGAPVGTLEQKNFTVLENGQAQKLSVFERQTGTPLSLTLAVDMSGSTHHDRPLEIDASRRFAQAVLGPADQMQLVEFSTDVHEVVPFTNRLSQIEKGLSNLQGGPATALYDAVYLGADGLSRRPQGSRRVLVVISDGGNTVKGVGYDRALERALRGEVMVYSIIDLPVVASAGRDTGGEHALITLSEQTGGRYYYTAAARLEETFRQVAADLRTQYLLGYYPPPSKPEDPEFRRIDVELSGSGTDELEAHHRTGYYSASAP